eukprot:9692314-Alexandrium_andersonii.AAC.1
MGPEFHAEEARGPQQACRAKRPCHALGIDRRSTTRSVAALGVGGAPGAQRRSLGVADFHRFR